jgi:hypothetical protein
MVKHLFSRKPAALTTIGWICFVGGVLMAPVPLKLILLSVARVLPQALCFAV